MSFPVLTGIPAQWPDLLAGAFRTGATLIDVIAGGGAVQISSITESGTFTVGDVVSFSIYDTSLGSVSTQYCTYTVETGVTTSPLVAAAMIAVWNSTSGLANLAEASEGATTSKIVLTFRDQGLAYTLTNVSDGSGTQTIDANLQDSATAENVEPGRLMCWLSDDSGNVVGARFKSSRFTKMAQTWTLTGTIAATGRLVSTYSFGSSFVWTTSTVWNTSDAQTMTDHVANLETDFNARFGAGTGMVATDSGGGVGVVTVDVPGAVFIHQMQIQPPNTSGVIALTTETGGISDPAYSMIAGALGFSAWKPGTSPTSIAYGPGYFLGGRSVPVAVDGQGAVVNSQSPAASDPMYIDGTTYPGLVFTTPGTTRVPFWDPTRGRPAAWTGYNNGGAAEFILSGLRR